MRILTLCSAQLQHLELDLEARTLRVALRSGQLLRYEGLEAGLLRALLLAPDKERFFMAHIEGRSPARAARAA